MKAYPTKYAGTQFRSRLEARWAAFFDLMNWTWEYEPFDLNKYIPDFLVDTPSVSRMLVEVKPATKLIDHEPAQRKIARSGWDGDAATVGVIIPEAYGGFMAGWSSLGMRRYTAPAGYVHAERDNAYWVPWIEEPHDAISAAWREAGNRVQWRGVGRVVDKPRGRSAEDESKLEPNEVASFFGNLSALLDD